MLFQNKYRIESTRLKDWDYSIPWWYYITINTKNHIEWFGKIVNEKMVLNRFGKIVDSFWREIPNHFENVELDYYVIMPNHIHGIIIINSTVETGYIPSQNKHVYETPCMASLPLGDIIGKFKAAVKRWANKNGYNNFSWQTRFYDRIIRNEKELFNIRKYIDENPTRRELGNNLT